MSNSKAPYICKAYGSRWKLVSETEEGFVVVQRMSQGKAASSATPKLIPAWMFWRFELEAPECEKKVKVQPEADILSNFLDWLIDDREVVLAVRHKHEKGCYPYGKVAEGKHHCGLEEGELLHRPGNLNQLLAHYFGIDADVMEAEKQYLLLQLRKQTQHPIPSFENAK